MKKQNDYSTLQLSSLLILRLAIGWHFLYEGIIKIFNPGWSSIGYLLDSKGFLAGLFHWMAANPGVLNTVDFLNAWGLSAVGLGLILGIFTRISCVGGMLLLAFYYLSHPPFIGLEYAIPPEGNYLLIDKTLIELIALWVIYLFPTGAIIGIDRMLFNKK